jgi:hypothetical protein
MSFLADFDAAAHDAFAVAGMGAFTGTYTAPTTGATAIVCRGFADEGVQFAGQFVEAPSPRVQISLLRADVRDPQPGAVVAAVIDGASVSYRLERMTERDPSMTAWLVSNA